jgi:undecaprenyl phosphate-alpha-L-ara4N flippase subunit ArnE
MSIQSKLPYILTLVVVVCLSFGQILFKLSARAIGTDLASSLSAILSWQLATALAIYAGATALWIYVLHLADVSQVYPIVGLTFILVPILAHFMLGEQLTLANLLGGLLISIGIAITVAI